MCPITYRRNFGSSGISDGNTIGTVVANAIILSLYGRSKQNAAFNALRILEDFYYQSGIRQDLIQVSITNISDGKSSTHKNHFVNLVCEQNFNGRR